MLPFARLIKYGNAIQPVQADFLMRAADGYKDLANPSRIIGSVGTLLTTTSQHLPGQTSSYNFTGSPNRYITLAPVDTPDLNISKPTGDYTIEYFGYVLSAGGSNWYLSCGAGTTGSVKNLNNNLYLQNSTGGGGLIASSMVPLGRWVHFALVQSGNDIYWYMDGTRRISTTGRWNVPSTPLRIGGYEVISNAYIDQIRISNSALYTAATITPPDYPFT